jgi:hypothetical protein
VSSKESKRITSKAIGLLIAEHGTMQPDDGSGVGVKLSKQLVWKRRRAEYWIVSQ